MGENYDAFGDVINDSTGTSVFSGDGADDYHGVRAIPTPQGMVFELRCGLCGQPVQLTFKWPVIIALKYGLSPHVMAQHPQLREFEHDRWGWDAHAAAWHPEGLRCPKCALYDGLARLRVDPAEPERYLQQARARRLISVDQERALAQLATQLAGRVAPR